MKTNTALIWSRRVAIAALATSAIVGVSACSSNGATPGSTPISVASPAGVQHMSVSQFSSAIAEPGVVLLDVRTPAEFAAGHLPGARNVDFENPNFPSQLAALDKNATYALYCRSGNRSGQALVQMESAGFTQIYDLTYGIAAWETRGGPVVVG
ncbi:MAG: rhodanese-like domain-containing protein [Actinomycetes bacterium]